MPVTRRIAPCLWFDRQAEEAARFYVSIFKNSRIGTIARYSAAGQDILEEMMKDHESPQARRVMDAMLKMKKLDIAALERAFAG